MLRKPEISAGLMGHLARKKTSPFLPYVDVDLCRQKYRYLSPLTAEEEKEIVSAINLSQGRWYKCPQGHVYTIGGCGEAMQRGTCPECRLVIGGTRHRLFEGNMRAPEMHGVRTRFGLRSQSYR